MNKKILAFFCAVAIACSLSACGNNSQNSSSTASEPQSSSSTAESNVSSDKIKDGTETLADGSKLTIKGDTITVQKDDDVGTITSTYEFENDTLKSCKTNFGNIKSKEVIENIKSEASESGYEVTQSDDNSITLKSKDETIKKIKEKVSSKADLINKIKESANNAGDSQE